jgi:hypothetical protein
VLFCFVRVNKQDSEEFCTSFSRKAVNKMSGMVSLCVCVNYSTDIVTR